MENIDILSQNLISLQEIRYGEDAIAINLLYNSFIVAKAIVTKQMFLKKIECLRLELEVESIKGND